MAIIKKNKIYDGVKFKRIYYSGYEICCICSKHNKCEEPIHRACDHIYIYCSTNKLYDFCYVYDK